MVRMSRRLAMGPPLKAGRRVTSSLCAVLLSLAAISPVYAQEGFDGLCSLFLQQQAIELEDLEVAVRMDETRLAVAEEVFFLLDGMWQNDLVERLPYLGGRYRRDVAAINLDRSRAQLARQQAATQQYRLACAAQPEPDDDAEAAATADEAYQRYMTAECEVRALDVAAFEVELAYQEELLRSSVDLRQNDIASRQQVLFDERDVDLTRAQLEQARQRTVRCGG